jgi:hypothetical protein
VHVVGVAYAAHVRTQASPTRPLRCGSGTADHHGRGSVASVNDNLAVPIGLVEILDMAVLRVVVLDDPAARDVTSPEAGS